LRFDKTYGVMSSRYFIYINIYIYIFFIITVCIYVFLSLSHSELMSFICITFYDRQSVVSHPEREKERKRKRERERERERNSGAMWLVIDIQFITQVSFQCDKYSSALA
jgi:hypothetical protein